MPEHSNGVWVRGAGKAEKTIALWGLASLGISGHVDDSGDVKSLQVIEGAYKPPSRTYTGEEIMEEITQNEILRSHPAVLAERDALKDALERTQEEREALRGQLGGVEQAWLTCKRQFALARLYWFAEKTAMNIAAGRADLYDDFNLVKQIKSVLEECTSWRVETDGSNNPTLMPHPEFKVVFDGLGWNVRISAAVFC